MTRDGRWDFLEGVAAEPLEVALLREAGRSMADELRAWPPQVRFDDPQRAAELAPVLAMVPTDAALSLAFELATLELEREFDARDFLLRGSRLGDLGESQAAVAKFVAGWLTEWLLELAERVKHRLPRRLLVTALDVANARLHTDRMRVS